MKRNTKRGISIKSILIGSIVFIFIFLSSRAVVDGFLDKIGLEASGSILNYMEKHIYYPVAKILKPFVNRYYSNEESLKTDKLSIAKEVKFALLENENIRLRKQVNFVKNISKKFISTTVLFRTSDIKGNYIVIAVGERHGLSKGNAVINPEGLIGRIVSTSRSTAKVILVGSPNFTLPAVSSESGTYCLIGRCDKQNKLSLSHVDGPSLFINEELLTVDGPGIFYGLPIAKVAHTEKGKEYALGNVNLDKLSIVTAVALSEEE